MQILLDTSDLEEIKYVNGALRDMTGRPLDGVTTNPTSMADYAGKHGKHPMDVARYIGDLMGKNVSVETIGTDAYDPDNVRADFLEEEGGKIAEAHPAFVVKVPSLLPGYHAAWCLRKRGIPVNMTLVFDDLQGVWAGEVGAHYVSPFVGRLDDKLGEGEGVKTAEAIAFGLRQSSYPTQNLFASVRHPDHVEKACEIDSHAVTMPVNVMRELLENDAYWSRLLLYRKHEAELPLDAVHLPGPTSENPEDVLGDARKELLLDGNRRFIEDAESVDYGHQMFGYPSVR